MAETDLHAKMDRLLAGQAAQAQATAELETSLAALVQGISGLVPLLGTHTELLQLIHQAATREAPGDGDLAELLAKLVVAMERVEMAVIHLPETVRQAVRSAPPGAEGGPAP